jgi:rhamnosyltransferase
MNSGLKIAGLLILYNPRGDILHKNIATYIEYMDNLIIIDNSMISQQSHIIDLMATVRKIHYFNMGRNLGIATAYNIAASIAVELGFDWLMLIDQDSSASADMMDLLLLSVLKFPDCGILAPLQITKKREHISPSNDYTDIFFTMASGSFLNLKIYQKCGAYEDKLFIDHVDHEYCLRLKRKGYKIIQCNKAVLNHSLGELKILKLFGTKYIITTHKPFRLYYFTRNGIYVAFKYLIDFPSFLIYFSLQLGKNIIKALFIEDNKKARLKMIYTGFSDFLNGRYGNRFN